MRLDLTKASHLAIANTVAFVLNNATDAIIACDASYPLLYIMLPLVSAVAFLARDITVDDHVLLGMLGS